LYKQPGGGYIVDTPGFSSLDMEKAALIPREQLPYCFREFAPYLLECRFASSCAHVREKAVPSGRRWRKGKSHARGMTAMWTMSGGSRRIEKSWMQETRKSKEEQ